MLDRNKVIQEAEEWLGLPWQHQASLKGVAADCIGLVAGIYRECGGTVEFTADYPATWHLFNSYERLYVTAKNQGFEDVAREDILPGDILLFRFGKMPANHCGLYLGNGWFIHSYSSVGKVVKTRFDGVWLKCFFTAIKYPGVD